jgi:hypothetical protein
MDDPGNSPNRYIFGGSVQKKELVRERFSNLSIDVQDAYG